MENNVLFALGLTIFAGLSTGIGSLIGFMSKQFNPRFLTIALGFSAGVMIYVSMIEIFAKARDSLTVSFGGKMGYVLTVVSYSLLSPESWFTFPWTNCCPRQRNMENITLPSAG